MSATNPVNPSFRFDLKVVTNQEEMENIIDIKQ